MFFKKRKLEFLLILVFFLFGCSKKSEYLGGLGFSISKPEFTHIRFNIYHSNSDDGNWEKIDSLEVYTDRIEKGYEYIDVSVSSENENVLIEILQKGILKEEKRDTVIAETINPTSFRINGLKKKLSNFSQEDIFYTKGKEQIFLLYPVSNKQSMTTFPNVSLDKPYDTDKANIDNILITITFLEN